MADKPVDAQPSKDEQIGYHKGSITTLSKERQELARILGIVDQLLTMHVQELKKLGVDLEAQPEAPVMSKGKKPIEDIL
jgi:hypothetical protein